MALYRQVGKSGLRVSLPILGGMSFGSPKWNPWVLGENEALPILKTAWDSGINTIDTANAYSHGVSESIIAKFIATYNIPRQNLVIMTKIWGIVASDPGVPSIATLQPAFRDTKEYVNQGGLSRTAIFNQVDACLTRLNTPYIDLLQIHAPDPTTPIEETMKALHDLVVSGKVRYIGACTMRAWLFSEMNHVAERNGWTPFISMQVEHSLLYRPDELELFAYCQHKGIGILSFSPLMDGNLARPLGTETSRSKSTAGSFFEKKLRESDKEIVRRVQAIAAKRSCTMAQVVLAWSAGKVSSFILGINSIDRVKESLVNDKSLSDEEVKALEEPYEIQRYRW